MFHEIVPRGGCNGRPGRAACARPSRCIALVIDRITWHSVAPMAAPPASDLRTGTDDRPITSRNYLQAGPPSHSDECTDFCARRR